MLLARVKRLLDYKTFGHPNLTVRRTTYYGIVSGIGALITFGFTFALTDWLGLWYMASLAIASVVSFLTKFILNATWTFNK